MEINKQANNTKLGRQAGVDLDGIFHSAAKPQCSSCALAKGQAVVTIGGEGG